MQFNFNSKFFNYNFLLILSALLCTYVLAFVLSAKDFLIISILIELLTYSTVFLFNKDLYTRSFNNKKMLETPSNLLNLKHILQFLPFTLLLSLLLLITLILVSFEYSSLDIVHVLLSYSYSFCDFNSSIIVGFLFIYFISKLGQGLMGLWNYNFSHTISIKANIILNFFLKLVVFKFLFFSMQFILKQLTICLELYFSYLSLFIGSIYVLRENKNIQSFLVLSAAGTYILLLWFIIQSQGVGVVNLLGSSWENENWLEYNYLELYLFIYNTLLVLIISFFGYVTNYNKYLFSLNRLNTTLSYSTLIFIIFFILSGLPLGTLFFLKFSLLSEVNTINGFGFISSINLILSSLTTYMLLKVLIHSKKDIMV